MILFLVIIAILAPVLYVWGFILDRGSFPDSKPEKTGIFFRKVSFVLFGVLLFVLLVGAIFRLFADEDGGVVTRHEPIVREAQALILPVSQANYVPIRDYNILDPEVSARSVILVDSKSNRILYSKEADKRLPIASITKLMTALVAIEHLDLRSSLTVSAENLNLDGFGPDFPVGATYSTQDMLKALLIESSNDAASILASAVDVTGTDFVARMNSKARQIGMFNTKFGDPAGLDDGSTYSTASDVVLLLKVARANATIAKLLSEKSDVIKSVDGRYARNLVATNQLLDKIPSIVMGKTGNTVGALGTMALVVKVNGGGDEILSVVLGSKDRFGETEKLITWAQVAYGW